MAEKQALLRKLPSVDRLLQSPELAGALAAYSRSAVVRAARLVLGQLREAVLSADGGRVSNGEFSVAKIAPLVAAVAAEWASQKLRPVINATGVILHTNLGRAPLAPEAAAAAGAVAESYANLELDLATGSRGRREATVEELLTALTGAEAAVVVNNNAAAVLLALTTLAAGGEVVVSRGELIEIGGSFRLPEVMAQSGARLREVGATNKTYLADYEQAVGESTALLLKAHTSNYRVIGFTHSVSGRELAELAHAHGLPAMEDLGSGALIEGIFDEPAVANIIKAGLDVVTFSGDKLLGGPQAGIIVGREKHLDAMKRQPLMRALRVDKLTLAALEATLRLYLAGQPGERVPVLAMIGTPIETLEARAGKLERLLDGVDGLTTGRLEVAAAVGGGALPARDLPSLAVAIGASGMTAGQLEASLRQSSPPVVARVSDDQVVLDLRTVGDSEVEALAAAVRQAAASANQ